MHIVHNHIHTTQVVVGSSPAHKSTTFLTSLATRNNRARSGIANAVGALLFVPRHYLLLGIKFTCSLRHWRLSSILWHRLEHHCFQIKINFIEMHQDFDDQFVLSASDFPSLCS
jgi:hypothetical protein